MDTLNVQHTAIPIFHQKEKCLFGAIFNLPFHSMPTIQSQEMLCQGTKGKKKGKKKNIRIGTINLKINLFLSIHITSSPLSDNQFYHDFGGLRVLKYE